MAVVFIDANIILGFWSLSDGRLPSELLPPLVDLKDHIFITQQISDEICRNKLGVFISNSTITSALNLPPEFSEHIKGTLEVEEINAQRKNVKLAAELFTKFTKTRLNVANEISQGTDLATQMLSSLLATARASTGIQLAAARSRRECGNPPGKKTDPLGDQISWQQYLDAVKGEDTAWIITRDGDFTERLNNKNVRALNPFLKAELLARGVRHVHVFDSLAEAIKALRASGIKAAEKFWRGKAKRTRQGGGSSVRSAPTLRLLA